MKGIQRTVVPWKSKNEWVDVKNQLHSQDRSDWLKAYHTLLLWKARRPNLPANIECTLGIIQVLVKEVLTQDEFDSSTVLFAKETDLQLAYSTALLRFVNHVSASTSLQGDTLYLAAHKQNIPDWVINLRHDIAHSSTIPPFSLLESAVLLAKQWLLENYWTTQENTISEVDGNFIKENKDRLSTSSLQEVLNIAVASWWTCQSVLKQKITRVVQLSDEEWTTILSCSEKLLAIKLYRDKKWALEFQTLVKTGSEQRTGNVPSSKKFLRVLGRNLLSVLTMITQKGEKTTRYLLEALIDCDFLKSADDWQMWWPLLQLLHKGDSLTSLVNYLLLKSTSEIDEEVAYSINWLKILAPLLESLRLRWKRYLHSNAKGSIDYDPMELPLRQPPEIELNALRPLLLNPTATILEIVECYIRLVTPKLPKQKRLAVKTLLELYTEDFDVDDCTANVDKVYSVNELTSQDVAVKNYLSPQNDIENRNCGLWKKTSIDVEQWRRTAIGLLPHQIDPELELPRLTWTVIPAQIIGRKRKVM